MHVGIEIVGRIGLAAEPEALAELPVLPCHGRGVLGHHLFHGAIAEELAHLRAIGGDGLEFALEHLADLHHGRLEAAGEGLEPLGDEIGLDGIRRVLVPDDIGALVVEGETGGTDDEMVDMGADAERQVEPRRRLLRPQAVEDAQGGGAKRIIGDRLAKNGGSCAVRGHPVGRVELVEVEAVAAEEG